MELIKIILKNNLEVYKDMKRKKIDINIYNAKSNIEKNIFI